MVKVKVANPGPAALMVLNPRGKSMKKRRTTTRRKTRRSNVSHRASTSRASLVRRSSNPSRRKSHARRRNPAATGLLQKGLALAASAAGVQFALGFVPPIGGVSPIADAARTAGLGYVLGMVMKRTGVLKNYGDDVALAGFTLAGGKLISSFILPFANRMFSAARPTQPAQQSTAAPANGVAGIAQLYPGLQPFSAYRRNGMSGIATWAPGQQPFNQYIPVA